MFNIINSQTYSKSLINGVEERLEDPLVRYECVALIVYSATSFENRDDLFSSRLAGESRSTATPAKISRAFVRPTDLPNAWDYRRINKARLQFVSKG